MYLLEFKGRIEGYVVNYINRNGWKVESTQTPEDLMQDAFEVYLRVGRKYPDIEAPQHFMALFKTAWARHFTDLANADTAARILVPMMMVQDDDGGSAEYEPVGDSDNDGELAVMLRQAPREVATVLNLLLSAPQELLDIALESWNGKDRRCKAGGSKRINRMLGLPENTDAMQAVHDYFH